MREVRKEQYSERGNKQKEGRTKNMCTKDGTKNIQCKTFKLLFLAFFPSTTKIQQENVVGYLYFFRK